MQSCAPRTTTRRWLLRKIDKEGAALGRVWVPFAGAGCVVAWSICGACASPGGVQLCGDVSACDVLMNFTDATH